jgi:hypothetical protein
MTDVYTVAAEGAREERGKSLRPAAREAMRVPAGTAHAVAPGVDATACGVALSDLQPFPDRVFTPGSLRNPCRKCRRIVRGT